MNLRQPKVKGEINKALRKVLKVMKTTPNIKSIIAIHLKIILLLFIFIRLASAGLPNRAVKVYGTVVDTSGQAMSGIKMQIRSGKERPFKVVADTNGNFHYKGTQRDLFSGIKVSSRGYYEMVYRHNSIIQSKGLPFKILMNRKAALADTSYGFGSIRGRVLNTNFEPLAGATVLIDSTKIGEVANFDGIFIIPSVPAGTYDLTASTVGYAKVQILDVPVNRDSVTEIYFMLNSWPILMWVNLGGRPMYDKCATSNEWSIGEEEIKRYPANTINDLLKSAPGFVK